MAKADRIAAAIERAERLLYSDPEGCIALCEKTLAEVNDELDFADLVLLKADAELALDDEAAARQSMEDLAGIELDDPVLSCTAGNIWWSLGEEAAAEAAWRAALAGDDTLADAHHGLGQIAELRGDGDAMIGHWLRTLELDAGTPPPEWHLAVDEFERIAEAAMAELPREVLDRLENVPVMIADLPDRHLVEEGWDPRLLGLFSGVPLPEKSQVSGQAPHIDTVHLYQLNLERACADREQLAEEIRITVLHETAHFFGLDDDDLDELGLG
ncbi:MAG TPA: metallopeptidase family protein [Kofleriaceae bacterium]|nr:metallopeptidase family protein [Kofleriaceae bacterium]